jgi:transposase
MQPGAEVRRLPPVRTPAAIAHQHPLPAPATPHQAGHQRRPVARGANRVGAGPVRPQPAAAAAAHGIRLQVVKLPEATRGFVLLPRRWVVERSFAWAARFRRLARDYERLPETVAGLHFPAFACLWDDAQDDAESDAGDEALGDAGDVDGHAA